VGVVARLSRASGQAGKQPHLVATGAGLFPSGRPGQLAPVGLTSMVVPLTAPSGLTAVRSTSRASTGTYRLTCASDGEELHRAVEVMTARTADFRVFQRAAGRFGGVPALYRGRQPAPDRPIVNHVRGAVQERHVGLHRILPILFSFAQPVGLSEGELRWLRPGLVHEVEWCLAGPAEAGQARPGDYVADPGLAGLGAEREPDLLRQ